MIGVRKALALASLWVPAAAILVTRLLWWDRLPADLPSHWGASGPADSATNGTVLFWALFGVALGAAVVGGVLALIAWPGKWTQRGIAAVAAMVAAYALAMWLMSAATSLDVADPYTVVLGPWVMVSFVAPVYAAVPLALLLSPGERPVDVVGAAKVEALDLKPGGSAAWSRTVSSKMFIWLGVGVAVLGAGVLLPSVLDPDGEVMWWLVGVMIVSVLLVVALCAFRVTVDWRGLRVRSWLLGIPLKRIGTDRIARVEAATLEPGDWGGWGYRVMPGRSAIILKRGPGLVVTMTNDKQFAVTLDRPEEPASVLLGLVPSGQ